MALGPVEALFVLAMLALVALPIAGAVDAAAKPSHAWKAAGQDKIVWVVLPAVGLVIPGLGAIAAIIYFVAIRPKVVSALNASTTHST